MLGIFRCFSEEQVKNKIKKKDWLDGPEKLCIVTIMSASYKVFQYLLL